MAMMRSDGGSIPPPGFIYLDNAEIVNAIAPRMFPAKQARLHVEGTGRPTDGLAEHLAGPEPREPLAQLPGEDLGSEVPVRAPVVAGGPRFRTPGS